MTATLMDGRAVAAGVRERVARGAAAFRREHGRQPGLGTVLVGDDPASATYIRMKRAACEQAGIASPHVALADGVTRQELLAVVAAMGGDDSVDGILVQMPLPLHIDPDEIVRAIPPEKDVDGFHPANVGAMVSGHDTLATCTPLGVLTLLDAYDVQIAGAEALVIGRSIVVGRPMALMLLARDATVTVAHLATRDLARHTRRAEILVSAAGVPGLVTGDMVREGAVVVDVGTTRTDAGLCGDVVFSEVREVARLLTPVPGGVGPMTIATLLSNTLRAAWGRAGGADDSPSMGGTGSPAGVR